MGKLGRTGRKKNRLKTDLPLLRHKMTHAGKRNIAPERNIACLSRVANAPAFLPRCQSVLCDANSRRVPLDVHQQTAALVTGNHFTAAPTDSYLHKIPQNT